jgi:DNA-3-methyladenine glycosylase
MKPITPDFFNRDLFLVAKQLLSVAIVCRTEDKITMCQIVETEAYDYPNDKGSHAYMGKRTQRNESMYLAGGHIYMYLCYGTNDMLNFSVGKENEGQAILVRAVKPLEGIEYMQNRSIRS